MYTEIIDNIVYTLEFYPLDEFVLNLTEVMSYVFPCFFFLACSKAGLGILKSACTW